MFLLHPSTYGTYFKTFLLLNNILFFREKPIPASLLPGSIPGFDVRKHRDYYIQSEKIEWDYLPTGQNKVNFYDDYVNDSLINGPNRVGSKYWKYTYKQYTDGTYTKEIPKPQYQGFVGPMIHGEVGEILHIHFRNNIDIPITVHPHGVRYDKANEGAFYMDGSSTTNKLEDGVAKGQTVSLTWKLDADFSLHDDDANCIPFAYHSHKNPDKEVNSGLIGLIIVCKQGVLSKDGVRSDVDREFVLYYDSINEGDSPLTGENLQRCGNPAECKRLYEAEDADFAESLAKDSINGYMYGNMPGFEMCKGQKVALYIFSLNKELHPFNIQGQTFLFEKHRTSVIGVFPASFRAAEMVAEQPGQWLLSCLNSEHNRNGMKNFMTIRDCGNKTVYQPLSGNVRTYYISAQTDVWNYAPSQLNMFDGGSIVQPGSDSEIYFGRSNSRIGGTYKKSRFFEYIDGIFATPKIRRSSEQHLGILGPVIRAEVGDTIKIVLQNRTPYPVSIYLQGTSMNNTENGKRLRFTDSTNPTKITRTGQVNTYTFTVPWSVAPGDSDPQCLTYMYYSDYDFERDVNSGLVGPLLICKPGALDISTGRQKYVNREMFLFYASMDENYSWYKDDNIAQYAPGRVDKNDEDFVESNIMKSINGRSFGNLEGLDMCKSEDVVWHVMSFGQTDGLHGVTFNGNNVMIDGVHRDSHVTISGWSFSAMMHPDNVGKFRTDGQTDGLHGVTFNGNNVMIDGVHRDSHVTISGWSFSAMMHPDNVGNWSIVCHNDNHFAGGMKATYSVNTCGNTRQPYFQTSGVTRTYYIAAVERKWNYAPATIHPLTGEDFGNRSSQLYNRVQKDGKFVGSIYTKALYREFTDATFTTEKPTSTETIHLGVLGPFIRAEVGDVVEVVFKNMASRPYSIHAQGLRYNKTYEGMKYQDGSSSDFGDSVQPGTTFTYRWQVPATSGPAPNEPNCKNLMYHSAVDPVKDTYSGLVGPIVICRKNILDYTGRRTDSVEREYALLFQAFDENESWYLNTNIQENCPTADTTTADFIESNKYDSINGYIYNNVRGLYAKAGENIAWYIMGLGESEDIHTAHFHGQTYTYRSGSTHAGDVVEVFPGTYETVEMFASNPGTWLLHCHVGEHTRDGMVATYTVAA